VEACVGERCQVVELRQYTLVPGQRETLIDLFDREFVETQEAVGMQVIGQFRDLDRPDRFVWFRGFSDMSSRHAGLEMFYGGPVWRAHAGEANSTMIDSDDVLLLRPVAQTTELGALPPRPGPGERSPAAWLAVTICSVDGPADVAELERGLLRALAASSPPPLATFVEEPSENTFPALPVRAGENVVVWIQRISGDTETADATLRASADVAQASLPNLVGAPTQLRLEPTPRSRLR
jgi:hypothetical protein